MGYHKLFNRIPESSAVLTISLVYLPEGGKSPYAPDIFCTVCSVIYKVSDLYLQHLNSEVHVGS